MVRRIGIIIVGATLVVALLSGLSGAAFAAIQESGEPCPPECVTDSMEIITWFPAPYGLYGELNSMKLAIGDIDGNGDVSEGDIPPADGQIYVDRGVIFKPIDPQNVDNDNINNMIHPAYEFTQKAKPGEMVYTTDDKFYHYNGSSWVPQGSGSGKTVIAFTCLWRYDYREAAVGIGPVPLSGAGSWGCAPQACPTSSGWSQLGDIFNDQVVLACSGPDACRWGGTDGYFYHPVSAGRSVRLCVSQ